MAILRRLAKVGDSGRGHKVDHIPYNDQAKFDVEQACGGKMEVKG